jgi:hypothetical protein
LLLIWEKKSILSQLKKLSPHLNGVLNRSFDEAGRQTIETCFNYSVSKSGTQELDFVREEGVSFNPRQARIGLLLINEADGLVADDIAAGILASSIEAGTVNLESHTIASGNGQSRAIDRFFLRAEDVEKFIGEAASASIPKELCNIIKRLKDIKDDCSDPALTGILAALWIDRARHLHQSADSKRVEYIEDFRLTTELVLQLAQPFHNRLYLLLATWFERYFDLIEGSSAKDQPARN